MYWKVCSFWIPQRDFGKVSPFKLMEKTFWWCFVENTNSWISPYLPLRSKPLPSWSAKDAISFGLDVNTPWLSASQYTSQGLGQSLKTNDNRLASRDRQGTSFCAPFSLKENNTFPKDSCCCRIRFTSQFIPCSALLRHLLRWRHHQGQPLDARHTQTQGRDWLPGGLTTRKPRDPPRRRSRGRSV